MVEGSRYQLRVLVAATNLPDQRAKIGVWRKRLEKLAISVKFMVSTCDLHVFRRVSITGLQESVQLTLLSRGSLQITDQMECVLIVHRPNVKSGM